MGQIEELNDDQDFCAACKKAAETKCTNCRKVFYCSKECQKKHWKEHKFECKSLPYKIGKNDELGRFLIAAKDVKKGDILWTESPLVVAPNTITSPVCLNCYSPVDGSYK